MMTEHNHEIDPTFSPLMPAHRQLNVHMKIQLEVNDITCIRPCKHVKICEVQSGGPQNLGCLPRDCRNFVDQIRMLRLGDGDAEAIHQLFCRLQLKDDFFFYSMDLDQDGRLCNVLWIHPKCRAAYKEFHDVVSFDTTYLINRKIQAYVDNFDGCSVDFKGIVYDSLTIENFEIRWSDFLVKYHLDNNVWLTGLYDERAKWVPVYLHETFWARMISTQRSEGMHAYFDEFVHSRSTLKQFME
ncbi:hypothetical protein ACS0TY_006386 [Phlomoides rotata]